MGQPHNSQDQGHSRASENIYTDPYHILGLSKAATSEEIKKAYRTALSEYHPDKVEHLGGDIKKLAEEKTKQIQWAYQQIKK